MKRLHDVLSTVMVLSVLAAAAFVINSETPRGGVSGTLVTEENGSPLANVRVTLAKTDDSETYRTMADNSGSFAFSGVSAGWYHLTADTQAHKQNAEKIEVREGAVTSTVWQLAPVNPFLQVFGHQPVFTTREAHRMEVHGFAPAAELGITTYRVSLRAAARAWSGAFTEALNVRARLEKLDLDRVPDLTRVSSSWLPIRHRDPEGVFREKAPLGKLSPGMYLIAFEAAPARAFSVITVTDLGIIAKASPTGMLVYAANVETGEPAPGAQVEFLSNDIKFASGVTGPDGTLSIDRGAPRTGQPTNVIARHQNSVAIAGLYGVRAEPGGNDKVFTYTDRPVYRPGHTVYFKSIVRTLLGDRYAVPSAQPAKVRVVDRNDDVVFSGDFHTNSHGSLDGSFALERAALPGAYTLSITTGGREHSANFMVAEYRKPEFVVKVNPGKTRYTRSEFVRATVEATYYYGAAVPNASVTWTVSRSPSYYRDDAGYWDEDLSSESETDSYYDGAFVTQGEGRTDEAGRLVVSFTPAPSEGEDDLGIDWQYAVNATVTDDSKFQADGRGATLVTQGDYRLEVRPDVYLGKPGKPISVAIKAVDYEGKPVAGASGRLELKRREWKDGEVTTHSVSDVNFETDAQGQSATSVTAPRDGDYEILARVQDTHGNGIRQTGSVFVMSQDSADYGYPCWGVEVHGAKRVYHLGETAEIVVHTMHPGQTALLTLEGASIAHKQVVKLTGKSNVLRVPVTADCMPAVNATVSYFHNKQYVSGSTVLNISRERKALRVEITSDKAIYQPGEGATYHVKTLSPDGQPVSAEVSLGLVDEAVYGIMEDQTPNIASFFYPMRLDEVRTGYSFPDIYLSGEEKAGSGIRTRRLFPDTAYWRPTTVTDGNGNATFHVTWPDNLTTWRATCRAADMETRVGQSTQKIIVQKPFLLRLEAPRFFIQGDEVEIAAVAHNLTGESIRASIGLDCPLEPIDGERNIVRNVGAGRTERIAWKIRPADLGGLRIRVWGQGGTLNDAMELTLPVLAKGREQMDTRCGDVTGSRTENMLIRGDCVNGTQELTVRLSPSIVSAMVGSLEYLAEFPYGCTEQTMSAFLPDIVLYRMLESRGIANPALRAKLPPMVRDGLLKLYTLQHEDGGWKWWNYDDTDPWMTAYVIYGLMEAKAAGFEVNPRVLSQGVEALAKMAANSQSKLDSDTRSYAAYVLTLAGRNDAASAALTIASSTANARYLRLSDWGRPWFALALAHTGRTDQARSVLASVWGQFSDRGFRPKRAEQGWRSNSEYAAALLYAECEINPGNPRLPDLTRWIMDQRRGNHWDSTRDTAAVLYALSRYVKITDELNADLNATISVNGRTVASRHLTSADMIRPEFKVTLGPRDLPAGPVKVTVRSSGKGRLYYTVTLAQTAGLDMRAPLANDSGVTVERRYRKVKPGETSGYARALANEQRSVTEWKSGDIVEVTLVVKAREEFDYLMVEDPLPAGAEVRDRGMVPQDEWGYWWADQIVRDHKVGFAIRHIDRGARHIQYRFTATIPGRYTALPPRVFDMYNPSVRGEGAADQVRIW